MKHRPKHLIEYALLRVLSGVVSLMPERVALSVGAVLAWMAYRLVRFRVAEAHRRIRQVLGDAVPAARVDRIAWISLRNTFFNGIDLMRVARVNRAWIARHLDPGSLPQRIAERGEGRGGIIVVPHMGNWDLAGVAAPYLGIPVFFIVGRQKNPLVDAWLNRVRGVSGVETIARDAGMLKKVIRNLKAGKVLAFMTDLRSRTPGVQVRFLGHPANLVAGMGLFARQTDAPILPALTYRDGWTRHRWVPGPIIRPDPSLPKEQDWQRMTQAVMDFYDAAIRASPEQYFWYNKRWVLDPLEERAPAGSVATADAASHRPV